MNKSGCSETSPSADQESMLNTDFLNRLTSVPSGRTKGHIVALGTLAHVHTRRCGDKLQAGVVKAIPVPYQCSRGALTPVVADEGHAKQERH